jgi:hypothetical protein
MVLPTCVCSNTMPVQYSISNTMPVDIAGRGIIVQLHFNFMRLARLLPHLDFRVVFGETPAKSCN